MKEKPEISVLIAVYNVEEYVVRCLESVFNNTIIDKAEIIIIDDFSTDNSYQKVENFIKQYKNLNITLLRQEKNSGLAIVRQKALDKANGKYFIYIDSDEWVEPDYLELLYNKAIQTNADCVGCSFYKEKNKTELISIPLKSTGKDNLKALFYMNIYPMIWCKLFKREIFINNSIKFNQNFNNNEDDLICLKFFSFADKVSYVEKPLYHYFIRQDSISYKRDIQYYKNALEVYTAGKDFLIDNNLFKDFEDDIFSKLLYYKIKILRHSNLFNYKKNVCFDEKDVILLNKWEKLNRQKITMLIPALVKKQFIKADLLFILYKLKNSISRITSILRKE